MEGSKSTGGFCVLTRELLRAVQNSPELHLPVWQANKLGFQFTDFLDQASFGRFFRKYQFSAVQDSQTQQELFWDGFYRRWAEWILQPVK